MKSLERSKKAINDSLTNEEIDEAIKILEEETKRRIEDIQQRVEFTCASLRAQGNTKINTMLMAIRELTMREFCETYGADTQKFLDQQTKERLGLTSENKKRRLDSLGATDLKRVKSTTEEPTVLDKVSVEIQQADGAELTLELKPNHLSEQFKVNIPKLVLLNDTQKSNVSNQIQALIDQLENLKKSIHY